MKTHSRSSKASSPRQKQQKKSPRLSLQRKLAVRTKAFEKPVTSSTNPTSALTAKQLQRQDMLKSYNRDGYVLIKNVFSPQEIADIDADLNQVCRGKYTHADGSPILGVMPFGDDISNEAVFKSYSSVENPHKVSPFLRGEHVILHPNIRSTLQAVIGPNVKCVASQLQMQSSANQLWHQDEQLIMTRDKSLVLAMIALDDITLDNGTPLLHPASHKSGVLYPTRNRLDGQLSGSDTSYDWQSLVKNVAATTSDTLTSFSQHIPQTQSEDAGEAGSYAQPTQLEHFNTVTDEMEAMTSVPVEMPKGSILFINGYTLQRMMPSRGLHRVLNIHFSSAETPISWSPSTQNDFIFSTLAPVQLLDVRDIEMVCGTDPYAYKGITNIMPTIAFRSQGPPDIEDLHL